MLLIVSFSTALWGRRSGEWRFGTGRSPELAWFRKRRILRARMTARKRNALRVTMSEIHDTVPPRIPPLQALQAFEAAARHQNYTRAAEELALTPSAISHHIAALEARSGERLFRRDGSRMVPTEAGRLMVLKVRQALKLLERTFGPARREGRTAITLSVLPSLAARWLVPRLAAFEADCPQVDLLIDANLAIVDLAHGAADCAIRFGPGGWTDVQQELLMGDERFPVASPRYQGGALPQRPEDLARHRLLRNPWMPWEPWFDAAGLALTDPPGGTAFNDASIMLDAAEAGLGIALARRSLVGRELRDGRLVRLFDIAVPDPHHYWFVWRANHPKLDAILAVRDWLKEQVES